MDTLDQGLHKLGLTPQLQRQAVQLELARRQPDKAIARLETLRTALKESPGWKLEMAELLLAAGRDEAAVELLLALESELGELRPTPARMAMQQQARDLQLQVHAQQSAVTWPGLWSLVIDTGPGLRGRIPGRPRHRALRGLAANNFSCDRSNINALSYKITYIW